MNDASKFAREELVQYSNPNTTFYGPTIRDLAAFALALLDRAEKAERELAEAKRQMDNCGGENCMGYRLDGAANWVREELLLEADAVLTAESHFRAQGRHVPDVEWLAYPAVRRALERGKG